MRDNKFSVDEILAEVKVRKQVNPSPGGSEMAAGFLGAVDYEDTIRWGLEGDCAEEPELGVEEEPDKLVAAAVNREMLRQKRADKTDEFVYHSEFDIEERIALDDAFEAEGPEEQAEEKIQDEDDEEHLKTKLKGLKRAAVWELVCGGVSFLVLLWLFLVNTGAERLPGALRVVPSQVNSALISMACLVVPVVFSSDMFVDGILRIFKLKANGNSLLSLLVLGVFVQNGFAIFNPYVASQNWQNMYGVVAAAVLVCSQLNKYIKLKVACNNIKMLLGGTQKFTLEGLKEELLGQLEYFLGPSKDKEADICFPVQVGRFVGVLAELKKDDYFDKICRIFVPAVLAALVGGCAYFAALGKPWVFVETAAAGLLCMATPMAGGLLCGVVLSSLGKRLNRAGAGVYSLASVGKLEDVGRVLVKGEDILVPSHMQLFKMELFEESGVDLAILGAASILSVAQVELADLFVGMLAGPDMLETVEGLNIEGDMGFSGWWREKRILFGSRELMINHGVRTPSRDFEKIRLQNERGTIISRALYVALDGVTIAMFIVCHKPILKVKRALSTLQKNGVEILLMTNDATLSAECVTTLYGLNSEKLKLVPCSVLGGLQGANELREEAPAEIVITDRLRGQTAVVTLAKKATNTVKVAAFLQSVGAVLGAGLVGYFAAINKLELVSGLNVLAYGAFWFLVSLFLELVCGV